MTTINYLLPLSSILLTAPGKHTVFLSCSLSLMLMFGSSTYGRLHPKGDILLSATIRQHREKSEMTSSQTTLSFFGYQKRCVTLSPPLVMPLTTFTGRAPFFLPSSPVDCWFNKSSPFERRKWCSMIKSHACTCKLGPRFLGRWLQVFILISQLSQKETISYLKKVLNRY